MPKWGLIDTLGRFVIEPRFDYLRWTGMSPLPAELPDGMTFVDLGGARAVRHVFDDAAWFSEGLVAVERDGLVGYMDAAGEIAIPFRYHRASEFCDARAYVQESAYGPYGFIDRSGRFVVEPRYLGAERFGGGRAAVEVEPRRYEYIDQGGREVTSARFREADRFHGGLACVVDDDGCGFIDVTGAVRLRPEAVRASFFSEGLCAASVVAKDGEFKDGYVDRSGGFVIPPAYDDASPFYEGVAVVEVGERRGYVDRSGHYVVPPEYEIAGPFRGGLAWVGRLGELVAIDRDGERAFGGRYWSAQEFQDGFAAVAVAD